ncbi:hypothetical protein TIFTF001_021259 [Ficus carica]|uniref:Secreted protein n=1 Tax=Ficus carica TaxID=3494 RepID=A0AA88ASD3_FICCA|nr:hypothetical protein TIFTF001_021259 [Ficus carica]
MVMGMATVGLRQRWWSAFGGLRWWTTTVVGCDNGDGIGDGGATTKMMVCRWWDWRRRGCDGDGALPLVLCR